ncbi:hypothetical protein AAZX31_12G003200 [Glycine max]
MDFLSESLLVCHLQANSPPFVLTLNANSWRECMQPNCSVM